MIFHKIIAALSTFANSPTPTVQTNVLILDPQHYLQSRQILSGVLKKRGPEDSYFTLEDNTGQILVTTESVFDPLNCQEKSKIKIDGVFQKLDLETTTYYLSLRQLMECNPSSY